MKKNVDKGFMLAETLIVASFIAIILIYLFVQFRNVNTNYSKTLKYNGVNELYLLEDIKDYLKTTDLQNLSYSISYEDTNYLLVSDCSSEIFTNTDYCQALFDAAGITKAVYMDSKKISISSNFSEGFNEFLQTIKGEDGIYVLAAEFEDGSYANIKMRGYSFNTLEEVIKNQYIYGSGVTTPGLYFDGITNNYIYIFKSKDGLDINNYINVLGYEGRIISIDNQGVKVYLDLRQNVSYDNNKSYFTIDSLLSKGHYLDNSTSNSSLHSILNSNIKESDKIVSGATYGVGQIDEVIGNSLIDIINSENSNLYKTDDYNYVATLSVSDIIRASLNSNCDYKNISNNCLTDNWLATNLWTMNYATENNVWNVYNNQFINTEVGQSITRNAYRVVYLKPTLVVIGEGTKENPYRFE